MPHPSDQLIIDLTLPDPRSMHTDGNYQKLTETCCVPHFKLPLNLEETGEERILQAQDVHKIAYEQM